MIIQKVKTSLVLDRTIPGYIIDEFPLFVQFMRAYYRQMEAEGETLDWMMKFLSNKDIHTVTDERMKFEIISTFLNSIPKNLEIEYPLLIQNIRSFYASKGTESSIKTLVYLMSETRKPNQIIVRYDGDEDDLVGRIGTGSQSGAIAQILRATRVSGDSDFVSLSVSYLPESKGRFFTSSDTLIIDNVEYEVMVDDFNIDIFYPKDYILRASDGSLESSFRVRIRQPIDEFRNLSGKLFSTSSGSAGRVDSQSYRVHRSDTHDYYDITLSFSVNYGWTPDELIYIEGDEYNVSPVIGGMRISDPGTGYFEGDRFPITRSGIQVAEVIVKEVIRDKVRNIFIIDGGMGYNQFDEFKFEYPDGIFGGGYVAAVSSGTITRIQISMSRELSPFIPKIIFDNGNQSATLVPVGNDIGGIKKCVPSSPGFDISGNEIVEIPSRESTVDDANINIISANIYETIPSFKDERGQLSSSYRLQDNNYWQDFSYVIRTTRQTNLDNIMDVYKKTVHPAGTKVFFEFTNTGRFPNGRVDMDMVDSDKLIEKTIPLHDIVRYREDTQIGEIERIKDTNPFFVYPHVVEQDFPDKKFLIDDHMYMLPETMTLEELEDEVIHRWTMCPEFRPTTIINLP